MNDVSEYDDFAVDYEWVYSDATLTGEGRVVGLQRLLSEVPPGGAIVDSACGTGITALALARAGFRVEGADASRGMIARAREHARAEGLDVPFTVCSWVELPDRFERKFDLVLCCGNAIGHCSSDDEMLRSLQGMRAVLKDSGRLLIDSRNWKKLLAERPRFTAFGVREREGLRCIPFYVWTFPDRPRGPVLVEVVFLFDRDGKVHLKSHRVTYYPFQVEELLDRLEKAGFTEPSTEYADDKDVYRVTVRRGSLP